MFKVFRLAALVALTLSFTVGTSLAYEAQRGSTGLLAINADNALNGYTLIAPVSSQITYLVDMQGNLVHTWKSRYNAGLHAVLLPNGNLLRAGSLPDQPVLIGGVGGIIEEFDWAGNLVWSYTAMNENEVQHHTFDRMPNGNTLILMWERVTNEQALAKGRDPNKLVPADGVKIQDQVAKDFWLDFVREVNPKGETVWEWHVLDHLGTGPSKLDFNWTLPKTMNPMYSSVDWTHYNTVEYVAETDQVILNSRNFGEFYLVDHKTGDIQFRWGNPTTYGEGRKPGFWDDGDTAMFGSHCATWVGDGKVIVFDNGSERPMRRRSRAVEVDTKTGEITWQYEPKISHGLFSFRQGAVQPLPNGNVLITSTNQGHLLEVNREKEVVWEYINPVVRLDFLCFLEDDVHGTPGDALQNSVHRSYRYAADSPQFKGRDLSKHLPFTGGCPNFMDFADKARAAGGRLQLK